MNLQEVRSIEPITFRRKIVNEGVVIGERRFHWLLKKQYQPLWALCEGQFLTEISPHKTDFSVFIPKETLKRLKGKTITVRMGDEKERWRIVSVEKAVLVYDNIDLLPTTKAKIKIKTKSKTKQVEEFDNVPF